MHTIWNLKIFIRSGNKTVHKKNKGWGRQTQHGNNKKKSKNIIICIKEKNIHNEVLLNAWKRDGEDTYKIENVASLSDLSCILV